MYSFCAIYSFRISFWVVPRSLAHGMPRCSATTRYIAQMIAAGELIVIEVLIWSSGRPSSRISMSASEEIATPHLPNSPSTSGWSVSRPYSVGISKAIERPVWPCSSRYLKRALVSSALPKPANMRIVQSLPR